MKAKLKILHLFNTYLPDTENWSYQLINNTPKVEIFVAAKQYLKGRFQNEHFTFYQHDFEKLEKSYVKLSTKHPFQLLRKVYIRLFKYPKLLLGGIKLFARQHEIDVIHMHFANMGWFYYKIALKLNIPFVISFYGWDYERLPYLYPKYKKRYQILFKKANAIICEGPHGAKILEANGCPKSKIKIINLGVQIANIKYVDRIKDSNELRLVQLATFTQKKGQIYSVKAFHHALESCPNMHLTLVGGERDKTVKEEIKAYISTHQLTQKITIIEAIEYAKLYSFLADYQVFIHPSCYADDLDCEGGAPVVLLDAQATGMPVIASTHCDIPMEVLDGQTGLLCTEKEVVDLAKNIAYFYNMGQVEFDGFAQAARKHITTHFDIKKNAQSLQRLYAEIKNQ